MGEKLGTSCIAVDAMGSDLGPGEIIAGVCRALRESKSGVKIIAVGDESQINDHLRQNGFYRDSRIEICHASQVIEMHEKPIQAMRAKKDSSMMKAIDLAKSGAADAVLSCGNTGALMAAGTIKLRTMPGIERPALGAIIPSDRRNFILIDVGANPDPRPVNMRDNAILGANYARIAGIADAPKVGLLSNGTEDGKGNILTQNAHILMSNSLERGMYAGLIEGFQVFQGDCDVIICDGFTGNILLKTLEGITKMLKGMLKEELTRNYLRKFGALLAMGAFKGIKNRIPVEKFSGAPLLGLNKLIVKGHGSSNSAQVAGALGIAIKCVRRRLNDCISADLERIRLAENKAEETQDDKKE
ncbi:MAG: phosphate acyltransferase PlsX [Opitutales bacterium]|nr:phosphate acyltransferase PlsX [Opitutales bacterium]